MKIAYNDLTATLYCDDAFDAFESIGSEQLDLIVTSPPYFIGKSYDTSRSSEDFLSEFRRTLPLLVNALKPGGSICWQVGNHVIDGELLPLDALIVSDLIDEKRLNLRNRIIWTFGHGAHSKNRLSGRHETILWYTKGKPYYFNLDPLRIPQKYPGKRAYKGPRKGQLSGNPKGKNPGDVWDLGDIWSIPNVNSNHVEKTEHPCQFPAALVRRLIKALSPPSGYVADPYMGSGTSGISALLEGRNFIGAEISPDYYRLAYERVYALKTGALKVRDDKPSSAPKPGSAVATTPPHFFKDTPHEQ